MAEREPFEHVFFARWGDMDFNSHMRNTAYLDTAADARLIFFAREGFPATEFRRLKFGPVIFREELVYFHETQLLDPLHVNFVVAGMSADGSRFRFRNEFRRPDRELVASVTSTGGWLDLTVRKLKPPPDELRRIFDLLVRTDDYAEL